MWINSIKHTNLKVASVLAPRHFISTDASSFFPLSVCFLFSSGGEGKKKNHQTLCGGFLRQSADTLLSAWLAFAIDQYPQFAFFPGPHHSVFCTLSFYWLLYTNCLSQFSAKLLRGPETCTQKSPWCWAALFCCVLCRRQRGICLIH